MNDYNNYKPNSFKSKEAKPEEKKKVENVVKGSVKTKKKNSFADVFISEDINNVKTYIIMDVVVPAVKRTVSDIVRNGIDMLLYGNNGRPSNGSKINYTSFSSNRDGDRFNNATRVNTGYEDITLDNRGDAEAVLNQLDDILRDYGQVSIADLYDSVGKSSDNYMHNRYGWTNLHDARVVNTRDGYLIKMPKATALK